MKPSKTPPACTLLGILDDGWAGLSDTARQRLAAADLVIGAGRTLELRENFARGVGPDAGSGRRQNIPFCIPFGQFEVDVTVLGSSFDNFDDGPDSGAKGKRNGLCHASQELGKADAFLRRC